MSRSLARATAVALGLALGGLVHGAPAGAQVGDSTQVAPTRPFVAGGYNDKPYLTRIFARIALGG